MDPNPRPWIDDGWLATDAIGHIAIFISAGVGPIPPTVLADRERTDRAEGMVWELPERCEATLHIRYPRPDDFVAFAARGLFAYDWGDVHRGAGKIGRYERIASPQNPLRLPHLPPELATLARLAWFSSLCFEDSPTVPVVGEEPRPLNPS